MKIALFHNLPSGGAKRAVYEWTRRLAHDNTIDVVTLASAEHDYCDIRPYTNQHTAFDFAPRQLFDSPWGRLNQLQRWRDLRDLEAVHRAIAKQIDYNAYDVVFAQPSTNTFVPLFLRYLKTPSVYYLHEPFGGEAYRQLPRPYNGRRGMRAKIDALDPLISLYRQRLHADQVASLNATQLLGNSRFTCQEMRERHGLNASFVCLGVDTDDFHPLPAVSKRHEVVSVGELTPRKGFDFVVRALGLVSAEIRPKLRIISNFADPRERAYVEQLAQDNLVDLHIDLSLNVAQLREAYSRAKLCVYAPVAEPLGLVALESQACGTPVVGVREGGVAETVQHGATGLLTERDPSQFAAAITRLLQDDALRDHLGEQALDNITKQWGWAASTRKIETHLAAAAHIDLNNFPQDRIALETPS